MHGKRPLKLPQNLLPSLKKSNRFGFRLSLTVVKCLCLDSSSPDLSDQMLSAQQRRSRLVADTVDAEKRNGLVPSSLVISTIASSSHTTFSTRNLTEAMLTFTAISRMRGSW